MVTIAKDNNPRANVGNHSANNIHDSVGATPKADGQKRGLPPVVEDTKDIRVSRATINHSNPA